MKHIILSAFLALTCLFALPASAQSVHNCIVVLVDGSGSMHDPMRDPSSKSGESVKMEVAKRTLLRVVPQVPDNTYVGLLVFDRGGIRWAYELGPMNESRFTEAVNGIIEDGRTPLGKSIKIAADQLMEERDAQLGRGSYKLIIATDGAAGDEGLMVRYTKEVVARGIRVDTIGVDMEGGQDHRLAGLSHSYQGANDSVTLETTMQRMVVAEAGGDNPVDFDLTSGLNIDATSVLIEALTAAPPNHAIGTVPPRPVQPKPNQGTSSSNNTTPQQAQPASCNTSSSSSGGLIALLLAVGVIRLRRRAQLDCR